MMTVGRQITIIGLKNETKNCWQNSYSFLFSDETRDLSSQMDPDYKRARSQYTSYASMWAGKWAQSNPTIKQEKSGTMMSENQSNSSPIPTPGNNPSPYPASFPEALFSNYDASNNMTQTQTYSGVSSNTGKKKSKKGFTFFLLNHPSS